MNTKRKRSISKVLVDHTDLSSLYLNNVPLVHVNAQPLSLQAEMGSDHRASCHRCGNLRKKIVQCSMCPQIFCRVCADLMTEELGKESFELGW